MPKRVIRGPYSEGPVEREHRQDMESQSRMRRIKVGCAILGLVIAVTYLIL